MAKAKKETTADPAKVKATKAPTATDIAKRIIANSKVGDLGDLQPVSEEEVVKLATKFLALKKKK